MKFYFIILKNKKSFFTAFYILFLFLVGNAQTSTSSPYSRYGIGNIEPSGFANVMAMGGSATAYQNDTLIPLFINQANPASYSTNRITTFEFGARVSSTNFTSDAGSVRKPNSGFNYISLAFPIKKNMGAAFGLLPFSNVGYNSTNSSSNDSIGQINYNYQGTGGINRVYAGFGIRPFDKALRSFYHTKKYIALRDSGEYRAVRRQRFVRNAIASLSLGTNVNFLYGTTDYYSYATYPYNYGVVFNTKQFTETKVHDVYFQGGAQMSFDIDSIGRHNLKRNLKFTLGYSVSLPKNIATDVSQGAYTFSTEANGIQLPFDTFAYSSSTSYKSNIYIPLMHSVGLGIQIGQKVNILLDGGFQQWSKYRSAISNTNEGFRDSYKGSIGFQYLSSRTAIGPFAYFKRISYRAGLRYNSGYLVLNGQDIGDRAVSFGLGLPVGRYKLFTIVNLSGEYGMSGTTKNQLVQERYWRCVIGLTFNDRWFIKTRYD